MVADPHWCEAVRRCFESIKAWVDAKSALLVDHSPFARLYRLCLIKRIAHFRSLLRAKAPTNPHDRAAIFEKANLVELRGNHDSSSSIDKAPFRIFFQ